MPYWPTAILVVFSMAAVASVERIQTSDKVCRAAIKQFATDHGIKVNVLIPPCYIAPCSHEGVAIDVDRKNSRKLRTYLAASSATRTCPRSFDVIKAGPGSDRRIRQ